MRNLKQLQLARARLGPIGALDYLISYHQDDQVPDNKDLGARRLIEVHSSDCGSPKISVVMTAFNSDQYIEQAISSVLRQTFKDFELIIVDDCSSDRTCEIVRRYAGSDRRIRLLRCFQNRGTYWSKNLGIVHARANTIALHDSDDISHPDRLKKQIERLESTNGSLCYCSYKRVDGSGNTILNRGEKQRLCFATAMFRKELLTKVGFFDSVRVGADDEFHNRVRAVCGIKSIAHLDEPLYTAPRRSTSLSSENPVAMEAEDPSIPQSFLSPSRRQYLEAFKVWHSSSMDLFMPFPLNKRPFSVPAEMGISVFGNSERVTASVASIPDRIEGLRQLVGGVLPHVDRLYVYLNNYPSVPGFLKQEKIELNTSDQFGDLKDNGKAFGWQEVAEGIHFMLDDDLIYPDSYFPYLTLKVLQYGRRCAVGVHGTRIKSEFKRYHDAESRMTFSFPKSLDVDHHVHILGTGTCAFDKGLVGFMQEDAPTTGMLDLWFARYALKKGVPMVSVSRRSGWLKEIESLQETSLYKTYIDKDEKQSELVRCAGFSEKPLRDILSPAFDREIGRG